jgi:solute carrier family 25 carnitine/acylcarnitine transporter 20/29
MIVSENTKHSIAGCTAGFVGTILGFPFDTVKTRMQTHATATRMSEMVSIIYKEGGLSMFYKGIASPLVALTLLNTLNFSTYSYFKSKLTDSIDLPSTSFLDFRVLLAGKR